MDTHICTCGHTSALKRKMHTMMFIKSKFNDETTPTFYNKENIRKGVTLF